MEDSLATPERSRSVKVTYLSRTKPSSSSSSHSRVPSSPSLKRTRQGLQDKQDLTHGKTTKSLRCRASSVSSVGRATRHDITANNLKPLSLIGRVAKSHSQKRFMTPDDDNSSIAESSKGVRTRRTEAERIQVLKDDVDCGDIEPNRAFCTKCSKWLSLGRKQTYALNLWVKHRERCDSRNTETHQYITVTGAEEAEASSGEDDAASTLAPSIAPSEIPTLLAESERQAILESDPRAAVVEPHKMQCKKCQAWIMLGKKDRFTQISRWFTHQLRCYRSLKGDQIDDAKRAVMIRVLRIAKDPQAKTFNFGSVECTVCGENVALDGEGDCDLTQWDEHRIKCPNHWPSSPPSPLPSGRELTELENSSNTASVQPPPYSNYSITVASNPSDESGLVRAGKKRLHEAEEDDGPPRNRPRKNSYESPPKNAPGPLAWLILPFKMFVRGFREGLLASTST